MKKIQKKKRQPKKASHWSVELIEKTGIPHTYSNTAAWFAERMVLASCVLMALSFSAGALFVLKLSEPISDSDFYIHATVQAQLAQEGIRTFSQQVIDIASPVFLGYIKANHDDKELTVEFRTLRKDKLKKYLSEKKSPFASDDKALDAFVNSKNMKMMVAISFVESTFGQHCYYFNCSGIGGTPPNLRKYDSYADWIKDFDDLLERRYKNVDPDKFIGLYVQPGSPNWIHGVKQVLREFDEQGIDTDDQEDKPTIKTK